MSSTFIDNLLPAKVRFTTQICASALSMWSSTMLILMIACSTSKFSTPFRRIIVGMSLGDAMQSLAVITGPFSAPPGDPIAPWAVGNIQSCNINGFIFTYGLTVAPLYILLLCVYLYFKIARRMSNSTFSKKIEWKAHCIINFAIFSICTWAMISRNFNTLRGGICSIAASPSGCLMDPETFGECKRGVNAVLFGIAPATSSFIGSMCSIILLCKLSHTYACQSPHPSNEEHDENTTENINEAANEDLHIDAHSNDNPVIHSDARESTGASLTCCRFQAPIQGANESDTDFKVRIWRREAIIQAIMFVTIFLVNGFALLIFNLSLYTKAFDNRILQYSITSIFFNLKGFFNIFIYVRPKVTQIRLENPEFSWLKSFCLVIKARGDIPDIRNMDNPRILSSQHPNHFMSDYHDGMSGISLHTRQDTDTELPTIMQRMSTLITSIFVEKKSFYGNPSKKLQTRVEGKNSEVSPNEADISYSGAEIDSNIAAGVGADMNSSIGDQNLC